MPKKEIDKITVVVRNGADFRAIPQHKIPGYGSRRTIDGAGLYFDMAGYNEAVETDSFNRSRIPEQFTVKYHFPKTPEPPYLLEISLNSRGSLMVGRRNGFPAIIKPGSGRRGLVCCFIPEEWTGKRITRKAFKIP